MNLGHIRIIRSQPLIITFIQIINGKWVHATTKVIDILTLINTFMWITFNPKVFTLINIVLLYFKFKVKSFIFIASLHIYSHVSIDK